MSLPRPVSVFCASLIVYFSAGSSQALVIYGGNGLGNTNDPSGGLPWGNAGSVGGASGVYLGNFETGSWVLSATHVTGGGAPGITLAGVFYAGVAGSGVQIRNGDNTTTDLALFRIAGRSKRSKSAPSAIFRRRYCIAMDQRVSKRLPPVKGGNGN
jgi:hypothetical protein